MPDYGTYDEPNSHLYKMKAPWIVSNSKSKSWSNAGFYNSTPWRKLRGHQLKHYPLCIECESKGLITSATTVDHVKPIEAGGEALDANNVQSMCTSCHNSKSAKERFIYYKK